MIKVDVRADVQRARAYFTELRHRDVNMAAANALNVVMRTTRNETLVRVQQVRQVRPSIVRSAIRIVKRASFASLSTLLEAVGRPISLKEYSARQGPGGVTVNVTGTPKVLLEAFGPGFSNRRRWPWRGQVLGGHVFARLTPARLPIKYLFGPSIPTGFLRDEVRAAQQRVMERDWARTFKEKIEDQIAKLGQRLGGR